MDFNSLLTASDTVRVQSGGRSILDKMYDASTAGVAGAVVSGFASIYNTAAEYGNKWFDAGMEKVDVGNTLASVDQNWKDYYQENKSVIDTAGFIGGSFLPGGLAVKAFNLWRTGNSVGRARAVFGYTNAKQQEYLQRGLSEMAKSGNDVYSAISKNKLASMAYGAADNVLQTAVFETAAALTMQQSSLLANENWKDIAWDITKSSLLGGAIGGGIEALWTNRIFKDASAVIDSKLRGYDTVVAANQLNLSFGEKAFALMDGLFNLPKEVLDADRAAEFAYRINGKTVPMQLQIGGLLDTKLAATAKKAEQEFQVALTGIVGDDPSIGAALGNALLDMTRGAKKAGKTDDDIRESLLGYLANLKGAQSLGTSPIDFTKDVIYVTPGASLRSTNAEGVRELFSTVRGTGKDVGYRVRGDISQAKSGLMGAGAPSSLAEAWKAGFDVVFSGVEGRIHINPGSKIFQKVGQPAEDANIRTVFNTRTKQFTDQAVATIADVADKNGPLTTLSGVAAGKYTYLFSHSNFEPTLDSIQNTARHLWASQVKSLDNVTIHGQDYSLLDRYRLLAAGDNAPIGAKIQLGDELVDLDKMAAHSLQGYINDLKLTDLQATLQAAADKKVVLDMQQLAYRLNVDPEWIQSAIAKEFKGADLLNSPAASRALESYKNRDNVVLIYDKPAIADGVTPDHATGYLAYQYKKKLAMEQTQTAAATVLGRAGERYLDIDPQQLTGKFQATGAGPTGFGFSNAGYFDPARRMMQDIGRATHLTQQEFRTAALEPLQSHFAGFVSRGDKNLGALLTKIRQSSDNMAVYNGKLVDFASLTRYEKLLKEVEAGKRKASDLEGFTFKTSVELSPEVSRFLDDYMAGHRKWLERHTVLAAASGKTTSWDPRVVYVPPIDTKRVPYFAFVRSREGHIFSGQETVMITAKSSDELKRVAGSIEADYPALEIIYKDGSERYHKALGDYEYSAGLNSPSIEPMLRKSGRLGDFLPVLEPQAVAEEFIRYIGRREDSIVRNAVQVKYAQTFEELDWLSKEYTKAETSKFQFLNKTEVKKVTDPFGDYKRLALNVSKKAEYTLWNQLNEFTDALGTRAYQVVEDSWRAAREGKTDWQEANAAMERVGIAGPFKSQEEYLARQTGADRSLLKIAVAKGNMLLANVALRLDTANALVNMISAPITMGMEVAALRNSIKRDPALLAEFEQRLTVAVPESQGLRIPATPKLIAAAIGNFFGKERKELLKRYTDTIGSVRGDMSMFHDMLEDVALTPNLAPKKWAENINKWTDTITEKGAMLTGNNFAEQFTRFVASDIMRQITDPLVTAGKMGVKEQNSFIAIFTNRVQGNYISSQRPVAFQGTLGAAIGLFQTYQFNLFQQLFRHIENRDAKTIAIGGALQTSIFGLNGLPMFDAINTHIIGMAAMNEGHHDAYSVLTAANKEMGDFLLYGAASAMPMFSDQAPALYTRGDLNPRHVSIVPVNPADIPVVEAGKRMVGAALGLAQNISGGGELGASLLHALEHNGISRPLAGAAALMQGRSTTNNGSIMAAYNDMSAMTVTARLLGARPMDEALAYNHKFRQVAYREADRERQEKLGLVVKQKIADGTLTEEDVLDFAGRYAAIGGRIENFSAALQRWTRSAKEPEVNTIMRAMRSSQSQRLFEVMGGDPLPDLYEAQQITGTQEQ